MLITSCRENISHLSPHCCHSASLLNKILRVISYLKLIICIILIFLESPFYWFPFLPPDFASPIYVLWVFMCFSIVIPLILNLFWRDYSLFQLFILCYSDFRSLYIYHVEIAFLRINSFYNIKSCKVGVLKIHMEYITATTKYYIRRTMCKWRCCY